MIKDTENSEGEARYYIIGHDVIYIMISESKTFDERYRKLFI